MADHRRQASLLNRSSFAGKEAKNLAFTPIFKDVLAFALVALTDDSSPAGQERQDPPEDVRDTPLTDSWTDRDKWGSKKRGRNLYATHFSSWECRFGIIVPKYNLRRKEEDPRKRTIVEICLLSFFLSLFFVSQRDT